MLKVNQEIIDPQTKIVFSKMNDGSILLRFSGTINFLICKKDLIEWTGKLDIYPFSRNQIIAAFERLEVEPTKKKSQIITALDDNG